MIEAGEPSFDDRGDGLDGFDEPPFQTEWSDAMESLDVLGLTCVSMLWSSLQVYFLAWEARSQVCWEPGERTQLFRKQGVRGYVDHIVQRLAVPGNDCPADLDLLEQVVLVRNAVQHPDRLTDLIPQHRRSDLMKHPRPFFMTDSEGVFLTGKLADVSFMQPRVRVSAAQLMHAVDEAEALGCWMAEHLERR